LSRIRQSGIEIHEMADSLRHPVCNARYYKPAITMPDENDFHQIMFGNQTPSFFFYFTDLILGLFWFTVGVLFTVLWDKWGYRRAKPTARAALESRLYHFARVLVLSVGLLLRKSDEEIKKDILDFNEEHLVFVYEQTEKLIDIYGHLIPIDVQDSLMKFGDKAGELANSINHVKSNYDIIEDLDEWKELRPQLTSLISDFDALVLKLTKQGLLSSQFSDHWNKMKALPTRTNRKPPKG
jgi:hypothetical protein